MIFFLCLQGLWGGKQGLSLNNFEPQLKGSRRWCDVNTQHTQPSLTTLADTEVVASLHPPPDTGVVAPRPRHGLERLASVITNAGGGLYIYGSRRRDAGTE